MILKFKICCRLSSDILVYFLMARTNKLRSIKTVSFTIRKPVVNILKTGHLRQYSVYLRSVFGPYQTVLSGTEIRTVLYLYHKRTIFGRFHILYGYNTVSRITKYCRVVSHISKFGDLPWTCCISIGRSPNFGICDTTLRYIIQLLN